MIENTVNAQFVLILRLSCGICMPLDLLSSGSLAENWKRSFICQEVMQSGTEPAFLAAVVAQW